MDIGPEQAPIVIEPIENPVPGVPEPGVPEPDLPEMPSVPEPVPSGVASPASEPAGS